MELELAKGATAFFEPAEKFKTILIEYKFRSLYDPEKATARTLLRDMMVTNSKKYPTQKEMDRQMSWLYGASLSSQSQRLGNQHVVTFSLKIVNDRYIGGDDTLLEQAFTFLEEIIFAPHAENNEFHHATFDREKKNLANYFSSLEDNKPAYASHKLNQILFKDTDQAYLGIGDAGFLEEITPASLYQEYVRMLKEDQLDIFVSGDASPSRIQAVLEKREWNERGVPAGEIFASPVLRDKPEMKEEAADVNQGTLLLGFSSPIYYLRENYFASLVFNGLFGGFPHSKLFQNVREKASLAYTASSYFDYLRGVMVIHTGIEFSKKQQAEEIVLEQLEEMKEGRFSDELIAQTKEMLINQYKQNSDYQSRLSAKKYLNRLAGGKEYSDEEWIAALMGVTKEEITEAAELLNLEAVFFLKGAEKNCD